MSNLNRELTEMNRLAGLTEAADTINTYYVDWRNEEMYDINTQTDSEIKNIFDGAKRDYPSLKLVKISRIDGKATTTFTANEKDALEFLKDNYDNSMTREEMRKHFRK